MIMNMAMKNSQILERSSKEHETESRSDTRDDSRNRPRDDGDFATEPRETEDPENSESKDSREEISSAAGEYTLRDVEILTSVLNTPSLRITPSSTIAHEPRFITLVGPPPPATETNTPETSTNAKQPGQKSGLVPVPPAAQPSTLFPSVATPPSTTTTTTLSAQKPSSQSPRPTSQSRSVQQPSAPAQSDPPRNGEQETTSMTTTTTTTPTASSIPTRSLESSLSLVQPSERPEKQPDSAPSPVSPPPGLSRGAEVGIVIGSIALAAVVLCAALFYYYKRKPSPNNIFTSRNKNLTPQRAISRPLPQRQENGSGSAPWPRMQQTTATAMSFGRRPVPPPVVVPPSGSARVTAQRAYPRTERPLPPLPMRQSLVGRGSNSYNRLP